ncbi:DsbA family protein [Candidatus Nanohalovita haloferacivicina]|uniref:DsbA family protein n=1 Tax=Candidatus Nanohalovita haloferacivicina TaxID=2978046 RepID=UPI00325FAEE5|nr:Protein-disulfide isomerase [Candidatus Nanohalobia archaeon BNXNv]
MKNQGVTLELTAAHVGVISLILGLSIGGVAGYSIAGDGGSSPREVDADSSPEDVFRSISNDLELDTEKVMQCYSNSNNSEALEDKNSAVKNIGRFGTPTFFVGNQQKGFVKISGAQTVSRFEQAFEKVRNSDSGELTSLEGIDLESEPSKGSDSAPMKIVEYNEYGCPFCAEWNGFDASGRTPIDRMNIGPSLENQYVESGEVELILKDYPVPQLHPNGPLAHKAANCVYEHEKESYWDFHDKLFEMRDQWMAE